MWSIATPGNRLGSQGRPAHRRAGRARGWRYRWDRRAHRRSDRGSCGTWRNPRLSDDQRSRCWIVAPAREPGHASAEGRTRVLGGLRRHGLTSRSAQAIRNWGFLLWIQMTSRHRRTRLVLTDFGFGTVLTDFGE